MPTRDDPLEPGQWHEMPPLKPGERAILNAEGRLRVEGDTTPGVCQICKAASPGHQPWCDAARESASLPEPLTARKTRLPGDENGEVEYMVEIRDAEGYEVGYVLDVEGMEELGALFAAAPRTARRLARVEAAATLDRLDALDRVMRIINVAAGWGLMEKPDIPAEFAADAGVARELLAALRAALKDER